jgi:hypothetical protein
MTHQATIPVLVHDYFATDHFSNFAIFGPRNHRYCDEHPIIVQVFYSDRGWRTTNYRKRVSCSWLRKLKAEGITHVGLVSGGRWTRSDRIADFSITEILRAERRRNV